MYEGKSSVIHNFKCKNTALFLNMQIFIQKILYLFTFLQQFNEDKK